MIFIFAFIALTFSHIPLKPLVLATALCTPMAQAAGAVMQDLEAEGERYLRMKGWGKITYLKCFSTQFGSNHLPFLGQEKKVQQEVQEGLEVSWPLGGQEVRTTFMFPRCYHLPREILGEV